MIVIYITDARPQYPPTVLTTLGLAFGAVNEYRYRDQWIQRDLHESWRSNGLKGKSVLLCFLEGNYSASTAYRAYCLRLGSITKSSFQDDYGIVQIELHGFVSTNVLREATSLSDEYNVARYGPSQQRFVLEVDCKIQSAGGAAKSTWEKSARGLAQSNTFKDASFAFLEGVFPQTADSQALVPLLGRVRLDPEESYDVKLHSYAPSEGARRHTYRIESDDHVLRISTSSPLNFQHKFWTFRLIGNTSSSIRRTSTALTFRPDPGVLGTELVQIIDVHPTVVGRLRRLSLPSIAAALAATPGVLGAAAPLWVKIGMIVVGSIGVAVTTRK